jgi:hypothetical protein
MKLSRDIRLKTLTCRNDGPEGSQKSLLFSLTLCMMVAAISSTDMVVMLMKGIFFETKRNSAMATSC